jgi:hypothetical protein
VGLPSNERSSRVWLGCILLIALGVRLGWGLTRPTSDAAIDALPDQREYLTLAQNLLHGRGLSFIDKRFSDTVYAFRTPGYPLFVAACGANIRAVRAAQAAFDTLSVLGVFLLASQLCAVEQRSRLPALAALIVAINPFLVYFTGLILSETLFAALIVWGMALLVRGGGGRATTWAGACTWLAGGLLLALSVLMRPSAVALPIVLGIAAAFVNRTTPQAYQPPAGKAARWPFPVGMTMVLLTLLVLLPWSLRNLNMLKRWVWLDTNGGITLYDGYNPDATGGSDQRFVTREPELQVLGEVDRSDYLTQKALWYARTHPRRDFELATAKLARTWSPVPLSAEFARPSYRIIALAYSLPLDVLVVLGLLFGRLPRAAKVLLLLPAIYFGTVHALTVGSLRYRIPAEPPMAVIAAGLFGAWSSAGDAWRRVGRESSQPT